MRFTTCFWALVGALLMSGGQDTLRPSVEPTVSTQGIELFDRLDNALFGQSVRREEFYWSSLLLAYQPRVHAELDPSPEQLAEWQAIASHVDETLELSRKRPAYPEAEAQTLNEALRARRITQAEYDALGEALDAAHEAAIDQFERQMNIELKELSIQAHRRRLGVLLPHQRQRYAQVMLHVALGRDQPLGVYRHSRLSEFVRLRAEDAATLAARAQQLAPDFAEQAAELVQRYRRQVLDPLPAAQRRQAFPVALGPDHPEFQRLADSLLDASFFQKHFAPMTLDRVLRDLQIVRLRDLGFDWAWRVTGHLDLTDDQRAQIGELAIELDLELQAAFQNSAIPPEGWDPDNGLPLNSKRWFQYLTEKYHPRFIEVLLPHQRNRLAVLVIDQQDLEPPLGLFKHAFFADLLSLSESQRRQLAEAVDEANGEFWREYRQLQLRFHQRLLAELSEEARRTLQESLGDPFALVPAQWVD